MIIRWDLSLATDESTSKAAPDSLNCHQRVIRQLHSSATKGLRGPPLTGANHRHTHSLVTAGF